MKPLTRKVADPIATIQRELDDWGTPFVELDVFGTADASSIAGVVDRFALQHLGAEIDGYLFYGASAAAHTACSCATVGAW